MRLLNNTNVTLILIITMLLFPTVSTAQKTTGIQGRIVDSMTDEPLPFVQIGFVGTTTGTVSDMDGRFRLVTDMNVDSVRFQMLGYEPLFIPLTAGKIINNNKIALNPRSNIMSEVVITAPRKKRSRYRRQNNPAVELVKEAINHKGKNRIQSFQQYNRKVYEKTTLSLDNFHPDFEHKRLWQKLDFLEKYIDQTPFDATPILTISMRETMMQQSYRNRPRQNRTLVTTRRMEGLDQMLGKEGIDASLGEMFVPFDIYDNDIELMLNHFTSPLNTTLATTFYKYYITDTIIIDSIPCIELSFIPANIRSYGFTGQLFITLDGNYAVRRYQLTVSPHVNLNFARDLTIIQDFEKIDSIHFAPSRCDTYGRLFINKRLQEVYAHQVRIYNDYHIGDTASLLPDSLFSPISNTATLPKTFMRRKVWNEMRPIKLTPKETVIDSLRYELARMPEVQTLKRIGEITFTGYIPTAKDFDSSRFDIGPIYNTVSHNHEEGWRIRVGGITTSAFSNRHQFEGYAAFGFNDRRPKGSISFFRFLNDDDSTRLLSHAINNSVGIIASYELETPGQKFDNFDRDNIIMSGNRPQKMQYVAQAAVRLRHQWPSHIALDTWLALRQTEPAGTLQYMQYQPDGSLKEIERFAEAEWMAKVSFSPNHDPENRLFGSSNMMRLRKDTPVINLSHRIAMMEGGFLYQRTDFSAEKRFWLSSFGHIDTRLVSGIVWDRVPYPRLCFPSGNSTVFLSSNAFNTMQPMEFVTDQYVALFATYHLKGLILNNIPLIKRLRLREVAGFNLLYGSLSAKNNPAINPSGLFKLPTGTKALGPEPYMEYNIGVENILKFIRIDYVRRLSYIQGMSNREKSFIRIEFKFTL